jgi:hypothetical protein
VHSIHAHARFMRSAHVVRLCLPARRLEEARAFVHWSARRSWLRSLLSVLIGK